MTDSHTHSTYPATEERINVFSHGLGLLLSIAALVVLTLKARGLLQITSVAVFAISLIALYTASTIYHSTIRLFTITPCKLISSGKLSEMAHLRFCSERMNSKSEVVVSPRKLP